MEDFVPQLNSLVKYSTPVLVSVAGKAKAVKPSIDQNSTPIRTGKGSSMIVSKVLPNEKQKNVLFPIRCVDGANENPRNLDTESTSKRVQT